jgi:precorrin-6B methylase 1
MATVPVHEIRERMDEDITIIGAGLYGTLHLTREAEDALRAAQVVFCSAYNAGIEAHVRALCPTAEIRSSEEGEYRVGMFRPDMYRRMAQVVLDAAREGGDVVVLAPGSAMVVDMVTQRIIEGAREAGLTVRVVPGISSIESVLAEVGYDASAGLQIVLAQRLVLERIELHPAIASLVLQPAYFDTLHFAGAPRSREGRFTALEAQLRRTLSADAPMALVITPADVGAPASVFWLRLGSMHRLEGLLSPRHTLFVPPERAPDVDAAFAARIASWDECLSRVELGADGAVLQQDRRAIHAGRATVPADLAAESDALAQRWRDRAR